MNPCRTNKRLIALMAAGALPESDGREIRLHLAECPGCQSYWNDMTALAARLEAESTPESVEVLNKFHQQWVARVIDHEPRTSWFSPVRIGSGFWRKPLAFGAMAALLLVLITFMLWQNGRSPARFADSAPLLHPPPAAAVPAPPTLASYHRAAEISPEALDTLITQQSRQHRPAPPPVTTSTLLNEFEN